MKETIVLILFVLYIGYVHSASSEKIVCVNKVNFATEVFDLVTADPRVILSGMDEEAVNTFVFVRAWVKAGKSRDELKEYTMSRCVGVEV